MRGVCASSMIVPARFDRRTASPHVALPLGQESPEQTPMAPWHHGNMASSLNFAPSLSPHPVHQHRVGATYVSAAGLAFIFCSNRLFSSSLRFTLGHVHESKTFRCPTALIRPQCFGHYASNPAYALPPTTKSYTDKTRIYSAASIIGSVA